MTEEERAELHRSQTLAQRQARRDRFIALAGDREARIALDEAWRPPLLAALEAQGGGGDDSELLEEMYVEIPPQDVFITEIPDELLI